MGALNSVNIPQSIVLSSAKLSLFFHWCVLKYTKGEATYFEGWPQFSSHFYIIEAANPGFQSLQTSLLTKMTEMLVKLCFSLGTILRLFSGHIPIFSVNRSALELFFCTRTSYLGYNMEWDVPSLHKFIFKFQEKQGLCVILSLPLWGS